MPKKTAKTAKKSVKKTVKSESKLEFKGFLSFLILHELKGKKLSGDELADLIGARRGDALSPGTIYPALKHLHAEKLVTRRKDGRKKYYRLTDAGKKEIQRLYRLFGKYFKGLKGKIPVDKRGKKKK